MGKLFNLRDWLTVPEAAMHLGTLFGEQVTEVDVYRLALDGHLCLSVNFINHATGSRQSIIPLDEAEQIPSLSGDAMLVLGNHWDDEHVMVSTSPGKYETLEGIYDLPLIWGERLEVEHQFQQLTGGPEVTLTCIDGCLVRSEDGTYFTLFDRLAGRTVTTADGSKRSFLPSYVPAPGLPEDCAFVVRTSHLRAFGSTPEKEVEADLDPRERTTHHNVIAALVELIKSPKDERGEYRKREFDSDIIGELVANYDDKRGISERKLSELFPKARRTLTGK